MQTQGGQAAEDAILSERRHFRVRVQVDWNNNGLYSHEFSDLSSNISDIQTDRALRGSAPEEIITIDGSSSAELRFTIGGNSLAYDGLPFTAIFSPYNGASPMYNLTQVGSEVKYDLGVDTVLGTVWYPQFIGNITELTPDRATGTVSIVALDRAEKLRRPVWAAPWAVSDFWLYRGRQKAQFLDTQGWIENCLQQCDVSATPRRPTTRFEMGLPPSGSIDGVGIMIPFAGSIMPTIGYIDNAAASQFPQDSVAMYTANGPMHPANTEGKRPLALAGMGSNTDGNLLKYWVIDRTLTRLNGTHWMGVTLNTINGFPNASFYTTAGDYIISEMRIGNRRTLRFHIGGGKVWTTLRNEVAAVTIPGPKVDLPANANTEIMAQWDLTSLTGVSLNFRVGNTSTGWQFLSSGGGNAPDVDELQGLLSVWHYQSMSDFTYSFRNMYGTFPGDADLWRNAKYGAVLDEGTNTIAFTPPGLNGRDAWDIITDLVSAEYGSALWDETGVFHFWNYDTIKHKQDTSVRQISISDTETLQITNSLDSVRNVYSVNASKRSTAQRVVYESNSLDSFIIPQGQRRDFYIQTDDVQFVEPRKLARHTNVTNLKPYFSTWSDYTQHGYCLQLLIGGTWQEPYDLGAVLDVSAWMNGQGRMVISAYNGTAYDARFAINDVTENVGGSIPGSANNRPALRVQGTGINIDADMNMIETDADSIARYGARSYQASGDWYQQYYNTEGLMRVLLPRTSTPIPLTDRITIPGDPRLQLGDTVDLYDPRGLGEKMRVQIYGITRSYSLDSGLTDTLSVELLRPAGVGIWDSAQYGLWDQSFIWS